MPTVTGKHSPNELAHGARMPSAGTKQNSKAVAPSNGNTKSNADAMPKAPASKQVTQNFEPKTTPMAKTGKTS